MACQNHPDRESVAACVICQVELCDECRSVVQGKSYCAEHAPPAPAAGVPEGPAGAPGVGPAPGPADDRSQENPVMALLCYIVLGWIAGVIILATDMKKSRYMRFHAWHSIFITIGLVVLGVVLGIVELIISHVPFVGALLSIGFGCVGLALFVLFIYMGIKAYNKEDVPEIPLITNMARQQADKMTV